MFALEGCTEVGFDDIRHTMAARHFQLALTKPPADPEEDECTHLPCAEQIDTSPTRAESLDHAPVVMQAELTIAKPILCFSEFGAGGGAAAPGGAEGDEQGALQRRSAGTAPP